MPIRVLLMALMFLTVAFQTTPPQTRYPVHVESLEYPRLPLVAGITGDVVLTAYIGPDGKVSITNRKSGHPLLLTAAEENLKKWRFQAGESEEIDITYHFKLEAKSRDHAPTVCIFDLPDSVTITSATPLPQPNTSTPKR